MFKQFRSLLCLAYRAKKSSQPCIFQERPNNQTSFILKRAMASSAALSTNRLSLEKSPYLLQHANNPVDWYPWGAEAFQKAKEENKPIFLSVGYSTCHWCHVMERESFENPYIGDLLNKHFVSIKVDREERPDVDKLYMTFVQATTGSGGWPMSVWLTPDLRPMFGGTYFPPDDRYYNRPGFASILNVIAQRWQDKRDEIESQGTQILDALMRGLHISVKQSSDIPPCEIVAEKCFETFKKTFDSQQGGFGKAPKFPQPVNFNFLFRYFHGQPDSENGAQALQMSLFTLQKMAQGGIHDHISQGFHRYSTDRNWHVPHFEKMLYDQGQLAVSYSEAYQITKDDYFAKIARDIFTYVNRDLSHPAGGFFSAEDADSLPSHSSKEKKEGAFCVWLYEEINKLLSENINESGDITHADVICYHFGIEKEGNVDPLQDPHEELKNQNVLMIKADVQDVASKFKLSPEDVESSLKSSHHSLFQERLLRPRPLLDDKMVAAWNGLMMSGFARGAQALGDVSLTTRAIEAATFLKEHMVNEESHLLRTCYTSDRKDITQVSIPIKGFVDDYAFVIQGLLDLYEASFDESWLQLAQELQETQNKLFWDQENGAYFGSPEGDNSIILRIKDDQDGAEPSPNSVSAKNLLRLSSIFEKPDWRSKAETIFKSLDKRLNDLPHAVPELVSSLMFHQSPVQQIIIVGDKDSDDCKQLIEKVHRQFLPNKVLLVTDCSPHAFLTEKVAIIKTLKKIDGKATAYVCENFACSLPVTNPNDLEKQLMR